MFHPKNYLKESITLVNTSRTNSNLIIIGQALGLRILYIKLKTNLSKFFKKTIE
jgi:hypothetical protein